MKTGYLLTFEYLIASDNPAHNNLSRIDMALTPAITEKLEDLGFKLLSYKVEMETKRAA